MGPEQPVIESAREKHGLQALPQPFRRKARIPRTDRLIIIIDNADQFKRKIAQIGSACQRIGPANKSRFGHGLLGKIGRLPGASRWLGHIEFQRWPVGHGSLPSMGEN